MHLQQLISDNFSRSASTYDDFAQIQVDAGNKLSEDLAKHAAQLVDGPILELGCGTGYLTIPIINNFGGRQMRISDISEEMLATCKQRTQAYFKTLPENVSFETLNAETFEEPGKYAAIISAFTLQWLTNLDGSLERLANSLKPGGKMFFSFPGEKSFPEWKALCRSVGVPYTGNLLPGTAALRQAAEQPEFSLSVFEENSTLTYPSILSFFHALKALGASTQMQSMRLTVREMRRIISYAEERYEKGFPMTCHIVRGCITREKVNG